MADRAEVEVALCKSYNRWMADIWEQGKGRLRWVTPLPLQTIDEAVAQLKFAHEHGACAVFMRGIEGQRLTHDPYFDPVFHEASERNMAIGVHIANSNPYMCDVLSQRNGGGAFWKIPALERWLISFAHHERTTTALSQPPESFTRRRPRSGCRLF